jgi:DNA-nicking Smr family endonuclease
VSWVARLWARAATWLESGTREMTARRATTPPGAPADGPDGAIDGDEADELPREPGSVAVLPTEASIDLHHFHPRDVPSVVDEYLRAAHREGLAEVLLIHGRGKGVQRSRVAKVLERHPLVETFGPGVGAAGQGTTVARLRPGKTKPKRKTSRPF